MGIIGGSVTYEQSRKLAEYENRKVSITFAVSDEQDAEKQTLLALDTARAYVHQFLGLGDVAAAASETTKKKPGPKKPPAISTEQIKEAAANTTVLVGGKAPETAVEILKANGAAAKTDPAAIFDDEAPAFLDRTNGSAVNGSPAPAATAKADPAAVDDIFSASAPAVTDEALVSAITRKNAKLNNPMAIRQLIGKYVTLPGQARDIKAELREDFLTKLEAL